MNGISAFVQVIKGLASPLCSPSCKNIMKSQPSALTESNNAGTLVLDF
jgi:hypothetical protein